MREWYILDWNKRVCGPVPVEVYTVWSRVTGDNHVDDTTVDGVRVSTIFMGLDHNFNGGDPIVFETMVFGGILDDEQARYYTWEEAERGHKEMVERVKRYVGC